MVRRFWRACMSFMLLTCLHNRWPSSFFCQQLHIFGAVDLSIHQLFCWMNPCLVLHWKFIHHLLPPYLHYCGTFFCGLREILWILFCFSPSGLNFWNSRKMLQILHLCSAHGSKKSLAGLHCKRVWKRGGSGSCWGADHSKSVTKHAWRCYWVCVLCPFPSPLWQWEEHNNNNNNEEGFTFGKIFGEICNSSIGS